MAPPAIYQSYRYAEKSLGVAAHRQKEHYDRTYKELSLEVGNYVWRWYPPAANRKMGKSWVGPFRVVNKPTEVNVTIQRSPELPRITVHINDVKPYYGETPEAWDTGSSSDSDSEAEPESEAAEDPSEAEHGNDAEEDSLSPGSASEEEEWISSPQAAQAGRPQRARRAPERLNL